MPSWLSCLTAALLRSRRRMLAVVAVLAVSAVVGLVTYTGDRSRPAERGARTVVESRDGFLAAERTNQARGPTAVVEDVFPGNRADRGPAPLRRTIIHTGQEFSGTRFGSVVVADGIALSRETTEAQRREVITGSYFSPVVEVPLAPQEQMDATFDEIAFSCDAVVPAGSTLTFEFRTIAYADDGEGWSEWREVALQNGERRIALGELAQQWQYRITLTAEASEKTPVVRRVTVATEQDPGLADEAFAFARRPEGRVGATQ